MGSSSNVLKRAGGVLVTIGVSHYCEKARWALERFQLPFEERRHVPILHMPAAYFASGKGTSTPIFKGATVVREGGRSCTASAHMDARARNRH